MDVETACPTPAEIAELASRIDRPLVLVGMMGCGKTTLGRKLAGLLGFGFVDADEEIERAARMSVSEIFATYGEACFRDGERRVIARLIEQADGGKVIALGGGAFADPRTRRLVLDKALAIWLDCEVETLLERVSRKDSRPLLRQGDPRETLTRLSAERSPAYAEAPIRVESRPGPQQRTLIAILKALDEHR